MKVAIIGAGISGLSAGIALEKYGVFPRPNVFLGSGILLLFQNKERRLKPSLQSNHPYSLNNPILLLVNWIGYVFYPP